MFNIISHVNNIPNKTGIQKNYKAERHRYSFMSILQTN